LNGRVRLDSSGVLTGLSGLAALLAVATLLSWALIAGVHAEDTYYVHQVSGVWLTLAADVERGVLYPPLYDGHAFGGTRYMPGQTLVYAGAREASGDRIIGVKLVVYALALLLFGLVFTSLSLLDCPVPVALGLVAVALASGVGLLATTAVGGDTLPVVLQLTALLLVARRNGRRAAAGAGLICALAILTKDSALWAPAAIVIWLLVRERQRVLAFTASLAATLAAGLGAIEAASHGRFSDNLLSLSGSSFMGFGAVFLDSPGKLITLAHGNASSIVVVVPFVLASFLLAGLERRFTLYHLSFVFALAILCVVLADPGAYYNHLLDLSVLSVILVGDLWRRAGTETGFVALRVLVLAALVWAIGVGYYTDVKPAAAEAARLLLGRADREIYAQQPPAGTFRPTDHILSEDPYVPLAMGQRPVVLDAFMLLRIAEKHPEWRRALIKRLDDHEFDKLVLLHRLDRSTWWRTTHFGLPIVEAMQRNYTLWRRLRWRDLWIYVPKHRPA
jgi:hypothetical protein